MASQKPILDPQHPEILEEARYWCRTTVERVQQNRQSVEARARVAVKPTGDAFKALTSGLCANDGPEAPSLQTAKMLEIAAAASSSSAGASVASASGSGGSRAKAKAKAKTKQTKRGGSTQQEVPKSSQEQLDAACALSDVSEVGRC